MLDSAACTGLYHKSNLAFTEGGFRARYLEFLMVLPDFLELVCLSWKSFFLCVKEKRWKRNQEKKNVLDGYPR